MTLLIILYTILMVCGFGFRYYRWWDAKNPDASWQAHALQWWWSYGGIFAVYLFRLIDYDTTFALIGQGFAVFGACAVGYVVGHAYINTIKN